MRAQKVKTRSGRCGWYGAHSSGAYKPYRGLQVIPLSFQHSHPWMEPLGEEPGSLERSSWGVGGMPGPLNFGGQAYANGGGDAGP